MSTSAADFTSESAKKQIGNDAFLNKDLMARSQNGPGIKNTEKLKIGIVGNILNYINFIIERNYRALFHFRKRSRAGWNGSCNGFGGCWS